MRKAPRLACGSQRTMCRNWFSPSTKWILGMELRSSVSGESRYLLSSVSGLVSRLLQLGLDLSGHSVNADARQAEAKTDSSYCRWREGTGTLCVCKDLEVEAALAGSVGDLSWNSTPNSERFASGRG